ncbi:hypothetical protein QBC39DRAFT_45640 [Podospora conica]|nr:hypothetical protein QBC39DRAFT_45640 [Schizothecium conicum]
MDVGLHRRVNIPRQLRTVIGLGRIGKVPFRDPARYVELHGASHIVSQERISKPSPLYPPAAHCNLRNIRGQTSPSPSLVRGGVGEMAHGTALGCVNLDDKEVHGISARTYMRPACCQHTGEAWAAASRAGARSRAEEFLAWHPALPLSMRFGSWVAGIFFACQAATASRMAGANVSPTRRTSGLGTSRWSSPRPEFPSSQFYKLLDQKLSDGGSLSR